MVCPATKHAGNAQAAAVGAERFTTNDLVVSDPQNHHPVRSSDVQNAEVGDSPVVSSASHADDQTHGYEHEMTVAAQFDEISKPIAPNPTPVRTSVPKLIGREFASWDAWFAFFEDFEKEHFACYRKRDSQARQQWS